MKMRSIFLASVALSVGIAPTYSETRMAAFDNTLTGLIPDIYVALDVVSRELVGYIPAVMRNTSVDRAAKDQVVDWPVTPTANVVDIAPAMVVPEPTDQTIGKGSVTITKSRAAQFGWVGEQQRGLNNGGPGYLTVQQDQIAQALRTLTNEIENDLAVTATTNASRAIGTVGTVPFATTKDADADLRKVLDDNGGPPSERSSIINTTVGSNLRKLAQLTKVNESGTQMTLRDGELLNLSGLSFKESNGLIRSTFTAGTNNGAASTNNAGYAVGATLLTLAAAGTGTIIAGDVITIAGDTNKYLVTVGDADVSNAGTITIAKPGLMKAIAAANTVITTIASRSNYGTAFSRNAIILASRAPAVPIEGDDAADRLTIQDPRSGLVFEFTIWKGYRKVRYEIAMAWGTAATKTEHIALLIG